MFSTPQPLWSDAADASGIVIATFELPADLKSGRHDWARTGTAPSGALRPIGLPIDVGAGGDRHEISVMDPTDTNVRRARSSEHAEATEVLSQAFGDDPIMSWMIGPGRDVSSRMSHLFGHMLRVELARGIISSTSLTTGTRLRCGTTSISGRPHPVRWSRWW